MTDTPTTDLEQQARRPLLCRIGLHKWRFQSPNLTATGCVEQCKRCRLRRMFLFMGGYIYER